MEGQRILGILLRAAITYLYLLLAIRVSGKRSVGDASPLDFLIALVIGDLPDNLIYGQTPVATALTAMGTLASLHLLTSLLSSRSLAFSRLLASAPTRLVEQGQLLARGLARERMPANEVHGHLRLAGEEKLKTVQQSAVELSGQLSFRWREPDKPAEHRDLGALRKVLR